MYFVMYFWEGQVFVADKNGFETEDEAVERKNKIMKEYNAFVVKKIDWFYQALQWAFSTIK